MPNKISAALAGALVLLPATAALADTGHGHFAYSTDGGAQIAVGLLLAALFATLIAETFHKTLAAGAVVAVMLMVSAATPLHIMDFDTAVRAVDWNVIFLLGSMMAIVSVLIGTRVFDWLNARMVTWARGRSKLLANTVIVATAVLSAFADNVTTVLFMAPVVSKAARSLRVSVWALAMPMVMAANIGGTATLIGDPPNVIVGVAAGLPFMDFIYFLAVPVIFMIVALCAFSAFWYRRDLAGAHAESDGDAETVELQDPKVLSWTLGVVGLTFLGFFTHSITHLPVGVVAFAGAVLTMAGRHIILRGPLGPKKAEHLFTHGFEHGIEWLTLGFFIFLFMAISSAEHTGLIAAAAAKLQDLVQAVSVGFGMGLQAKLLTAALLILVFSAVVSAVVDNIPYTIAAAAIVRVLAASFATEFTAAGLGGTDLQTTTNVLWWSLALGACLGGNGTLIGASANVTTIGLLEKDGHHMPFVSFLRFGLPVTAMTVGIAALYLTSYVYGGAVQTNVVGAMALLAMGVAAVLRGMSRRTPKTADETADGALSPPAGE
ncbi:possible tyrosine transporter P-protein [Azospirillum oryzae]|uniref:Possible tyrosine transporter P-protein n=1 Tax=Azospirillum oryzae TaxID=286727 RepID=A0A1X7ENZ3_9PROT|nr:SLC13 family permease [Azospirillum oryzae]SMF37321.1 possible tyrosine transporter P-protein [Azospirillum oryzae]